MPKQQTDASVNSFQQDTRQKLRAVLAEKRLEGNFEIVKLPPTPFEASKTAELGVRVSIGDYVTWIYPDGAHVIGLKIDNRFELPDYRSLDELQTAYLKSIEQLFS